MKQIVLLFALMFTITSLSQGQLELIVTQDAKLSILEDDHGNKPFTPDIRIDFRMNGFKVNK